MGTLYIDRRGTRLDFVQRALLVREPEAQPRSVPLRLIDRLVVIGEAELTSSLLTHLSENGTAVVFMPARGQRRSAFLRGDGHGDALRRLGQYRLAFTEPEQPRWARGMIRLRVAGQKRLLASAVRQRPDLREQMLSAQRELEAAHQAVRTQADTLEALRGQEGAAGAAFFRGYVGLFATSLGFTGRNRRPPPDPVNAVLSLGYTLAHGDALRAIMAVGLDPGVGLLHQPAWGRESLACDLTELARSRVEQLTWRLFADQTLRSSDFSDSSEGVRLAKAARQTFFARWEMHAGLHRAWQRRLAQALATDCAQRGAFACEGEATP